MFDCDGNLEFGPLTYDIMLSAVLPPVWAVLDNTPETCYSFDSIPIPTVGSVYFIRPRTVDLALNNSDECIDG